MYIISKEFHFSASHQLSALPESHPCARLHGHNYIVTLILQSESLDQYGFVQDYRALDKFKNYIDENLDHRHLNQVFGHDAVTAEFLAKYLYDEWHKIFPQLCAVKVSETPKSWAEYRKS